MGALLLLWWSSIGMGGAALIWMFSLIFARVRRARRDARRDQNRRLIQGACLDIAAGAGDAVARLSPMRRRARLLAETLVEFLAIIRGVERERLISAFQAMAIDEVFRARLRRGSKAGRVASAEVLAAFPGRATIDALTDLLETSQDPELRVAAVKAMIDLDSPPPIQVLLDDIQRRGVSDSLLYQPLIRQLAAYDPDAALKALTDEALDPGALALVADAVAAAGDYRAITGLAQAARHADQALRVAAVAALGGLAHPEGAATVVRALDDGDWEVRAAACEAAARMNIPQAVPGLITGLGDAIWWVRFQAADALTRMGPIGIEGLRQAATSDLDSVRRSAGLALAEHGLNDPAIGGASNDR